MLALYDDMEEVLAEHRFLIGDDYTIADAAFTPYVNRLDHLDIMGVLEKHPRVLGWYRQLKARPSFENAITRWENEKYLTLMKRVGRENWPKIQAIIRAL